MQENALKRLGIILGLISTGLFIGCSGYGTECHNDLVGNTADQAYDMGEIRPRPGFFSFAEMRGNGILQSADDEDWFRFVVKDPLLLRWNPAVTLIVFPASGTLHDASDFEVTLFDENRDLIEVISGAQTRLSGVPFHDDGTPIYARVRWRDPQAMAETLGTSLKGCVGGDFVMGKVDGVSTTPSPTPDQNPAETPTPSVSETQTPSVSESQTPSEGDSPTPTLTATPGETPSPSPSPSPSLTPDDGDSDRCTRFVLQVRN